MKNVVVCVIHLSRLDCTKKCITHLRRTEGANLKILLLIQGPQTSDAEEYFRTLPSTVTIIRSAENIGSCRGRLMLIARAKELSPEYVLILDNDIYVPPNWFTEMERTWASAPADIAAIGMTLDYGTRILGGFKFGIDPVTRILIYDPISAPYNYDIVCDAPLDGAILIPIENLHLYNKDPNLYESNYHGFDMLLSIQKAGYKFVICSGFVAPHMSKKSTEYLSIRFKKSNPKYYQYFCQKWVMKMNRTQYLKIALATQHPALWSGISRTLSISPLLMKAKEYITINTAMAQNTREMAKRVTLPLIFVLLLISMTPIDATGRKYNIPWFIEWGGDNPGYIAPSLVIIYSGLLLSTAYVLVDSIPLVWVPILSLTVSLFASDYWEVPMFIFTHIPHYSVQVTAGERGILSFLCSSSLLHLYWGIVSAILLKIKWSRRRVFIFLLAPWIMWIVNILLPLPVSITDTKHLDLGVLGVITSGVAKHLHSRIVCWVVIMYLVKGSAWRGPVYVMKFCRGVGAVILEGQFCLYTKWILKYAIKGNWALGTEMAYWEDELKNNRPEGWIEPIHDEIRPAIALLNNTFCEKIRVLEMGPGPRSRLTEGYREGLYDLVAIDPLAEDFKKYLSGEDFLVHGFGEEMDRLFPPETFHMSYASNSLDHSEDALRCFKNLVRLTKINGLIIIQGGINEGNRTNWLGLHKYNMWMDRGVLFCCTRYGVPTNLIEGLPLRAVDSRQALIEGYPWFSITYRKVTAYE